MQVLPVEIDCENESKLVKKVALLESTAKDAKKLAVHNNRSTIKTKDLDIAEKMTPSRPKIDIEVLKISINIKLQVIK